MKRREFITLLGGAAASVSPARAQEPRRVIGILTSFDFASLLSEAGMPAFVQGLKDAGFVEGRNINFEIRQAADGHYDRLPSLAAELVGRDVAAIFAADLPSAFAAKAATKTIPIVFATGADPVKVGLVDSLSRPKGNLTGTSLIISVLGPKRAELLHELLPGANTIALLANPGNVNIKTDEPEIRAIGSCSAHDGRVVCRSLRKSRDQPDRPAVDCRKPISGRSHPCCREPRAQRHNSALVCVRIRIGFRSV